MGPCAPPRGSAALCEQEALQLAEEEVAQSSVSRGCTGADREERTSEKGGRKTVSV